ncbi:MULTISPECIES: VOC family protein [unclassified Pedobacter]|uniref:VOC family protein n=1 Tax=Pedobacter TaxID=84567 RepID=UPI0022468B42|nr:MULTISPECIES: VOC family protein [unclassified Pedobacter]MCX2430579.1 VOC family protein [Pedobacter sp. GR22-10]MCX2585203.1 VOC family protein [Pedobacter sp. MR22-3]
MRKIIPSSLLLLSFFFFQHTMAQQKPAVLNHIAVYVSDLNKSTAFYGTVFNLKEIPEPFKDGKHTWFSLGNAGALHLIQGAKGNQIFDKNEHLCFSVSSIDTFIKVLSAKNIAFEDWAGKAGAVTLRVDGVKQVYFKDPDGHWLETNDAK